MTETTSFDSLRMELIKLPQENKSRALYDTVSLPLRDSRAVDVAVVCKLLLGPAKAPSEGKCIETEI